MISADGPVDCVRAMEESDLELVLSWRNHPDIRRFMYSQDEISVDEHLDWFRHAIEQKTKHLLIFEIEKIPHGFVQFSKLRGEPVAEWGFYAEPNALAGIGMRMGQTALRYAFIELGFKKICGQALAYNAKSIKFHHKLGFQQEGLLRNQHYDGKSFHDVYCFGLLRSEWVLAS